MHICVPFALCLRHPLPRFVRGLPHRNPVLEGDRLVYTRMHPYPH